ncbi:hypothetical protein ACFQU9_14450 [Actinomadura namibiensis]|uniref:Uncharacterized protein n=1 Tax=Actinomadura namibiensis TaxID=182080 RepID=A0A7W3QS50_ACTNM|nr:hypothetical protein [Actinomadura namibiensis]MBA8957464.1 hypothetical protein [Actinomadura namibiensis]
MTPVELIERWRQIVIIKSEPWVLFAHGTCLFVPEPVGDLQAHAIEVLREHGPVPAGTPARAFGIIELPPQHGLGWTVTGLYPGLYSYVNPDGVADKSHAAVLAHAQGARNQDSAQLQVIHIERHAHRACPARRSRPKHS